MIWDVTIKSLQPIVIAEKYNADAAWNTTHYIPGSTWRGAFAELWKYRVGFDHPLTKTFTEKSIFRDAHLENSVLYPVYYKVKKSGGTAENFLNELIDTNTYRVKTENDVLYTKFGYEESPVLDSHLGIKISRTREATEKGKLYTMNSIAEGTVFKTTASIPEEILEKVCTKTDSYQCTLYVGKKRSSGFGKVEVTFTEKKNEEEDFKHRVNQLPQKDDTFVVVLVAKSSLILLDEFLLPTTEVNWLTHIAPIFEKGEKLAELIGQLGDRASFDTFGYGAVRDGWQQSWDMLRTSAHVLLPGSVHIAKFKGISEKEKELILEAVQCVEQKGIGERVQEGFGQVELLPEIKQMKEQSSAKEDLSQNTKANERLLTQAKKFAKETGNKVPISQWQALLKLNDPRKELMSEEVEEYYDGNVRKERFIYYLQRRLVTTAESSWKRTLRNKIKVGEALRNEIKIIENEFNESEEAKNQAVKIFINFLVREKVRLNLESKENERK